MWKAFPWRAQPRQKSTSNIFRGSGSRQLDEGSRLAEVPIVRVVADNLSQHMTEYALWRVLNHHRQGIFVTEWCIRHIQGYNHDLLTCWREIATRLGLDGEMVRKRIHRFNREGVEAFEELYGSGRPRTYSPEQIAIVIGTGLGKRPADPGPRT